MKITDHHVSMSFLLLPAFSEFNNYKLSSLLEMACFIVASVSLLLSVYKFVFAKRPFIIKNNESTKIFVNANTDKSFSPILNIPVAILYFHYVMLNNDALLCPHFSTDRRNFTSTS